MRILKLTTNAKQELANWKQTNIKRYNKIKRMLEQICMTPKIGIGKPEALKYEWTGYWSRRIDRENRLVYRFDDNYIYLVQAKGHYPNPPDKSVM
ncbi:MAG: Txe/YoeB family addiction module toxin [Proteobacteria bacterium]|nr:Txe/YoeB family addiction module toxin [Pseudomonadota bacterium]